MAQGEPEALSAGAPALPAWKSWTAAVCAVLLALLMLVAGVWKTTDPLAAAVRMTQALIPGPLSLPVALFAGVGEIFCGVLLLVPRWRRWGAWLTGLAMAAFMVYMGWNYQALAGEECNCFPWVKRAVGPAFFIGDAVMLAMSLAAGVWSRPPEGMKRALAALGAIVVFAGVTYGVIAMRETGARAPATVLVDGKAWPLSEGKVFVYFFDPQCMHCYRAAEEMGKYRWKNTRVLVAPTVNPQWTERFLSDTGLKAPFTTEGEALKKTFPFVDPPFGVALDGGRQVKTFPFFDGQEPASSLKAFGFIE
jgi:uncharacterized membrane protein YphA (DoxX/SURF4 family)